MGTAQRANVWSALPSTAALFAMAFACAVTITAAKPDAALHLCGGGVCRARSGGGDLAALQAAVVTDARATSAGVPWQHPWLRCGRQPFELAIVLVARRLVQHVQGVHTVDLMCALEADGWLVLDLDHAVWTSDIRGDLVQALADAGVNATAHVWSVQTTALLFYRPTTIHAQLWSGLEALPATVAHVTEDDYEHVLLGAHCLMLPMAHHTFVRYPVSVHSVRHACIGFTDRPLTNVALTLPYSAGDAFLSSPSGAPSARRPQHATLSTYSANRLSWDREQRARVTDFHGRQVSTCTFKLCDVVNTAPVIRPARRFTAALCT